MPGSAGSDGRSNGNDLPGWALAAAPEMPGFPWPALVFVAAAVALGSRGPRGAAALALVLLLAVFAFEEGLHSVHHGMNHAPASSCQVAAAGAHLNATAVDDVAPCDVVLPGSPSLSRRRRRTRSHHPASPEQGRAPPCSFV